MSWNVTETNSNIENTKMFTKNLNNKNYVALVNSVYEAKAHKSVQEIWAIVVQEKLNFMYTTENNKSICAGNCIFNMLQMEEKTQVTRAVVRGLRSDFNSKQINKDQIMDEDLELGMKMFAFMIYCPWVNSPPKCISGSKDCITCVKTRISLDGWPADHIEKERMWQYSYLLELLSHQTDGTLIQSLATLFGDNTVHTGLDVKQNLFKLKSFYDVMYNMLNCTYGKVTVALSSLRELTNTSTVPYPEQFISTIDKCINLTDPNCSDLRKLADVAYQPEYEEMSNHPVHLKGQYSQLFPSALIPYCSFGTDMFELGEMMDNFTQPICTAFTPTLHNGQTCYELDTDRIKEPTRPANNSGLVLLLDIGMERSVTVRNKEKEAKGKPLNNIGNFVLGEELSNVAGGSGLVYVHTLQPYTFKLSHDTNLILTSVKAMTGTENCLALPDIKKDCSVEPFERCKINQFVTNSQSKCNCFPYGHSFIRGNRTYKVS